jgi:putative sigma-54 modulation protein
MSTEPKNINVNIAFKNTEATNALKEHATDKIKNCLSKFAHQDQLEAHVVLNVEKNRQIAEVTCRADGADFVARQESDDMYAAIDGLIEPLSQQLRKHKEKMTKHH